MFEFLSHLFIPRHTNNHRAKILHNTSIALIAFLLLSFSIFIKPLSHKLPEVLGISYSISEQDMLLKVNKIRAENNLPPLTLNGSLSVAAQNKARDMLSKNYWAHFPPDNSTSPWMFIKNSGYSYLYAGENLAKGFTDSDGVINGWMNSPSHRDNILSSRFKDIGFAIVEGSLVGEETVLVVQMFGARESIVQAKVPQVQKIAKAPSIIPTPLVQKKTLVQGAELAPKAFVNTKSKIIQTPLIDIRQTTRTFSLMLLSILLGIFTVDFIITKRKELPRLVGHNLDHIMLLGIFIIFIFVQRGGGIL